MRTAFSSSGRFGFRRLMAAVLSVLIFIEPALLNAAEGSFWNERRKALSAKTETKGKAVQLARAGSENSSEIMAAIPHAQSGLTLPFSGRALADIGVSADLEAQAKARLVRQFVPEWLQTAIAPYATIHQIQLAQDNPDAKTVLILQDAHLHFEAQKNIAGTVEALARELSTQGSGLLVGLEGADVEKIRFDGYTRIADRATARVVSKAFLKANIFNGVEYAAAGWAPDAKGPVELPFQVAGIEDQKNYRRNVAALREAAPMKDAALKSLELMQRELTDLKKKHFTLELHQYDGRWAAFEGGHLGVPEFAAYLDNAVQGDLPNVNHLVEAALLEKTLKFDVVERQRREMLETLVPKMTPAETEKLLQYSLLFKSGQIAYGAFYEHVKALAASHNVPFSRFSELSLYVQYVLKSEKIDHASLFDEMAELQRRLEAARATTPEQREILALTRETYLLKKLVDHALVENEWHRLEAQADGLGRQAERLSSLGVTAPAPEIGAMAAKWPAFLEFYRAAVARNDDMSARMADRLSVAKAAHGVLVSGGFHTGGVLAGLRKRGLNVLVVTPKITQVGDGPSSLDFLSSGRLPLDQMFTGSRLFLAVQPVTSNPVNGPLAERAFDATVQALGGTEGEGESGNVSAEKARPGKRAEGLVIETDNGDVVLTATGRPGDTQEGTALAQGQRADNVAAAFTGDMGPMIAAFSGLGLTVRDVMAFVLNKDLDVNIQRAFSSLDLDSPLNQAAIRHLLGALPITAFVLAQFLGLSEADRRASLASGQLQIDSARSPANRTANALEATVDDLLSRLPAGTVATGTRVIIVNSSEPILFAVATPFSKYIVMSEAGVAQAVARLTRPVRRGGAGLTRQAALTMIALHELAHIGGVSDSEEKLLADNFLSADAEFKAKGAPKNEADLINRFNAMMAARTGNAAQVQVGAAKARAPGAVRRFFGRVIAGVTAFLQMRLFGPTSAGMDAGFAPATGPATTGDDLVDAASDVNSMDTLGSLWSSLRGARLKTISPAVLRQIADALRPWPRVLTWRNAGLVIGAVGVALLGALLFKGLALTVAVAAPFAIVALILVAGAVRFRIARSLLLAEARRKSETTPIGATLSKAETATSAGDIARLKTDQFPKLATLDKRTLDAIVFALRAWPRFWTLGSQVSFVGLTAATFVVMWLAPVWAPMAALAAAGLFLGAYAVRAFLYRRARARFLADAENKLDPVGKFRVAAGQAASNADLAALDALLTAAIAAAPDNKLEPGQMLALRDQIPTRPRILTLSNAIGSGGIMLFLFLVLGLPGLVLAPPAIGVMLLLDARRFRGNRADLIQRAIGASRNALALPAAGSAADVAKIRAAVLNPVVIDILAKGKKDAGWINFQLAEAFAAPLRLFSLAGLFSLLAGVGAGALAAWGLTALAAVALTPALVAGGLVMFIVFGLALLIPDIRLTRAKERLLADIGAAMLAARNEESIPEVRSRRDINDLRAAVFNPRLFVLDANTMRRILEAFPPYPNLFTLRNIALGAGAVGFLIAALPYGALALLFAMAMATLLGISSYLDIKAFQVDRYDFLDSLRDRDTDADNDLVQPFKAGADPKYSAEADERAPFMSGAHLMNRIWVAAGLLIAGLVTLYFGSAVAGLALSAIIIKAGFMVVGMIMLGVAMLIGDALFRTSTGAEIGRPGLFRLSTLMQGTIGFVGFIILSITIAGSAPAWTLLMPAAVLVIAAARQPGADLLLRRGRPERNPDVIDALGIRTFQVGYERAARAGDRWKTAVGAIARAFTRNAPASGDSDEQKAAKLTARLRGSLPALMFIAAASANGETVDATGVAIPDELKPLLGIALQPAGATRLADVLKGLPASRASPEYKLHATIIWLMRNWKTLDADRLDTTGLSKEDLAVLGAALDSRIALDADGQNLVTMEDVLRGELVYFEPFSKTAVAPSTSGTRTRARPRTRTTTRSAADSDADDADAKTVVDDNSPEAKALRSLAVLAKEKDPTSPTANLHLLILAQLIGSLSNPADVTRLLPGSAIAKLGPRYADYLTLLGSPGINSLTTFAQAFPHLVGGVAKPTSGNPDILTQIFLIKNRRLIRSETTLDDQNKPQWKGESSRMRGINEAGRNRLRQYLKDALALRLPAGGGRQTSISRLVVGNRATLRPQQTPVVTDVDQDLAEDTGSERQDDADSDAALGDGTPSRVDDADPDATDEVDNATPRGGGTPGLDPAQTRRLLDDLARRESRTERLDMGALLGGASRRGAASGEDQETAFFDNGILPALRGLPLAAILAALARARASVTDDDAGRMIDEAIRAIDALRTTPGLPLAQIAAALHPVLGVAAAADAILDQLLGDKSPAVLDSRAPAAPGFLRSLSRLFAGRDRAQTPGGDAVKVIVYEGIVDAMGDMAFVTQGEGGLVIRVSRSALENLKRATGMTTDEQALAVIAFHEVAESMGVAHDTLVENGFGVVTRETASGELSIANADALRGRFGADFNPDAFDFAGALQGLLAGTRAAGRADRASALRALLAVFGERAARVLRQLLPGNARRALGYEINGIAFDANFNPTPAAIEQLADAAAAQSAEAQRISDQLEAGIDGRSVNQSFVNETVLKDNALPIVNPARANGEGYDLVALAEVQREAARRGGAGAVTAVMATREDFERGLALAEGQTRDQTQRQAAIQLRAALRAGQLSFLTQAQFDGWRATGDATDAILALVARAPGASNVSLLSYAPLTFDAETLRDRANIVATLISLLEVRSQVDLNTTITTALVVAIQA